MTIRVSNSNRVRPFLRLALLAIALVGCGQRSGSSITSPHTTSSTLSADANLTTQQFFAAKGITEKMSEKVVRSDSQWRSMLTSEQYRVLREKGTERPYANEFDHHSEPGTYSCAACGQELFSSETKFKSGCGWPAFYAAKAEDRVVLTEDISHGMVRTEVTCARCDSHLGHIFDDAPQTPTGQRYCINSVSMIFTPLTKPADGTHE